MKPHSTCSANRALLVCGSRLIRIILRHVIAAPGTDFQLALFAFGVDNLYPHGKFVHSSVVFLLFGESESQTVPCHEITNDLFKTGAVIADTIDPDRLAATLLRQPFGAAVETDTHPSGYRLADRQKKFEECAQIDGQ